MSDLRKKEELLDKRKVAIIEAVITYLLTVVALDDDGSSNIINDINSTLYAIDDEEPPIDDTDLQRIIDCLMLSRKKFSCRMII